MDTSSVFPVWTWLLVGGAVIAGIGSFMAQAAVKKT
jgi:hypothetical protein